MEDNMEVILRETHPGNYRRWQRSKWPPALPGRPWTEIWRRHVGVTKSDLNGAELQIWSVCSVPFRTGESWVFPNFRCLVLHETPAIRHLCHISPAWSNAWIWHASYTIWNWTDAHFRVSLLHLWYFPHLDSVAPKEVSVRLGDNPTSTCWHVLFRNRVTKRIWGSIPSLKTMMRFVTILEPKSSRCKTLFFHSSLFSMNLMHAMGYGGPKDPNFNDFSDIVVLQEF